MCKQKRGPGFKYASNLPGSLLREQRPQKEEGGEVPVAPAAAAAKKRPDREETPRYRPEEVLHHRQPPMLSPSGGLSRPRLEEKLRKKRKLFDEDEYEDLGVHKKVRPYGVSTATSRRLLGEGSHQEGSPPHPLAFRS